MRRTSALTLRIQPGRSRRTFRPDSDSVLSMTYVATARPPTLRVLAQRSKVYHHAGAPPSARNGRAAMTTLRSRNWFGPISLDGLMNRASLRAEGFSDLVFDGRPVVGVANSWSELNNCNAHLRQVAEAVKRGVWSAGGFPLEFPVISLGEILMKPTTMLFRNLMAMDVEVCIRAYPLDAVVLLSGCDKTPPAMLMGAASADVPALMVTGGPMLRGTWRSEELGSGTDLWRLWNERRAGRLSDERSEEHTSELQSQSNLVYPLFFLNDPATTEIYPLSLHAALPILAQRGAGLRHRPLAPLERAPRRAAQRRGAVRGGVLHVALGGPLHGHEIG